LLARSLRENQQNSDSVFAAQFGVYEWVMTDKWDPSNPEHKRIAHGIEVSWGRARRLKRHQNTPGL
jgi:hypothetical protein